MARLGRRWPAPQLRPRPSTTVAFDAIGAGSTFAGSGNHTYTHVLGSAATCLLAWANNVTPTTTPGVLCGGVKMTSFQGVLFDTTNTVYLWLWVLMGPPTGSQTITFQPQGGTFNVVNTVSYSGVTEVGYNDYTDLNVGPGPPNNTGTALSMTQNITAAQAARTANYGGVAQCFASSESTALTLYNQNSRYNFAGGATSQSMMFGDNLGGVPPYSFTGHHPTSGNPWGSIALPLYGGILLN
jgi:hypothetical protein